MVCRNTQAECGERGACGNLDPLMLNGEAKSLLTTRTDTVSATTYLAKHYCGQRFVFLGSYLPFCSYSIYLIH